MVYRCTKKSCRKISHSLTLAKRRCFYCHSKTERIRFNTDTPQSDD
jgi:hypothetical protein